MSSSQSLKIAALAITLFGSTLALAPSASAAPKSLRRFSPMRIARGIRRAVSTAVARKAWHAHARHQVSLSNRARQNNGSIMPQVLRSSSVARVQKSTDGRWTNFEGKFTWATGQGGRGVTSGPTPMRFERGSFLGDVGRALGIKKLPALQLQPVSALETRAGAAQPQQR